MASKKEHKKLRDKQKRFCEEYLIDLNGTQAAIRAGYSKKSANRIASENLSKPDIQNYISELQKDIQERNKITVDECVSILANIARFDIAEIYDEDGQLKPIREVPKNIRQAIGSIETEQTLNGDGEVKKVKTLNKEGAIDKLMKYLGGYEEHNRQKEKNNVVIFNLPDNGR